MDNYVLFLTPLFRRHLTIVYLITVSLFILTSSALFIIHIIIPDQRTALTAAANHINLKTLVY